MNTFMTIALFICFAMNFLLLAGIYTLLKFLLIRHREVEARVETIMLETMFLKEQP